MFVREVAVTGTFGLFRLTPRGALGPRVALVGRIIIGLHFSFVPFPDDMPFLEHDS